MRKIMLLTALCVLALVSICWAETPSTKKSVVLIYKVEDVALQCQNAEDDIVAGRQEFEKELVAHYKKRFAIEGIKRGPKPEEKETLNFYRELAGDGKSALVVTIILHGQGASYAQYQNSFGAKATGVAPTVNVSLTEVLIGAIDSEVSGWDYGTKSYGSGTFAVGMSIFAAQESPRVNAKNSIRGIFRDACKLDESINRYASPTAYEIEVNRYNGNFKEATEVQRKLNAPIYSKIEKFVAWCNADKSRSSYLAPIENTPSLDFKINYINTLMQMGIYKD